MYQMHEGTLELPLEWQDKTMNVFVSQATGTEGVSFVITRERLPWGMKFHEYKVSEIRKISGKVPGYAAVSSDEDEVSGRSAYAHEFTWSNNGASIHQRLTMVEYGDVVLMLTFTAPGTVSDSQREQIRNVVASLQLRAPD
ncbi:DcrB-related protein [Paraburkholderia bannensis]|uniref:DcrB-related protein n=1 Tax=Paraburkholderia bannensis TaxID=765414 RepID=UPI002AB1935D|nr:DcrB-related protein [Paraburkholderia bannensis]